MNRVWIVYHDSGPDNNILGVFASLEEANAYARSIGGVYPKGVLTSDFPVPWRYYQSTEGLPVG